MGNPVINLPFGDGLYHPFMLISGWLIMGFAMVYHITGIIKGSWEASSELRMTFIQKTLHHITIHLEGWCDTLHHIAIHHEGWCETLHHITTKQYIKGSGDYDEGW